MKLLLYSKLFPNSQFPHAATFVRERARQLAKHTDTNITVVAPVPYFPIYTRGSDWHKYTLVPRHETDGSVEVFHPRFPVVRGISLAAQALSMYFASLPTCLKLHQQHRFDWVDAHFVYPDGLAGLWIARRLGIPVCVTARGSDINLFATFSAIRPMIRYTLRRADLLVAVSQDLARKMEALGAPAAKLHAIENAVDPNVFRPRSFESCRSELGLPPDVPIILSVGNLVPEKNHQLLLRALTPLVREAASEPLRQTQLHLIGDGPLLGALRSLAVELSISRSVFFHGRLPQGALVPWYNAATVFCLPSLREGNPNVVLEALACGVPVVASRVDGLTDLIKPRENGLLFDPQQTEELQSALSTALQISWDRHMIAASRQGTWEDVAHRLYGCFSEAFPTPDSGTIHESSSRP